MRGSVSALDVGWKRSLVLLLGASGGVALADLGGVTVTGGIGTLAAEESSLGKLPVPLS